MYNSIQDSFFCPALRTKFITTTEETLAKRLARLFKDNILKLHRLPEYVILDRRPQFVAKLTKKLNKMLGIEIKLSTSFHLQINGQTERINQKLEQYL